MTCYPLNQGRYVIGDPAIFVKKNKEGDRWITMLWNTFYLDMNQFQQLTIDGITCYITRTAEGDYYYQGIGTDTGTLMIIQIDQLHDDRFHVNPDQQGIKFIEVDYEMTVCVDRFNLYFSNGLTIITNSDDMI